MSNILPRCSKQSRLISCTLFCQKRGASRCRCRGNSTRWSICARSSSVKQLSNTGWPSMSTGSWKRTGQARWRRRSVVIIRGSIKLYSQDFPGCMPEQGTSGTVENFFALFVRPMSSRFSLGKQIKTARIENGISGRNDGQGFLCTI